VLAHAGNPYARRTNLWLDGLEVRKINLRLDGLEGSDTPSLLETTEAP
jgi:hypothetical protein